MRFVALVAAIALPAAAFGEQPRPKPTAFEEFVADPEVIVELEQWVGSIVNADAKPAATASIATNRSSRR